MKIPKADLPVPTPVALDEAGASEKLVFRNVTKVYRSSGSGAASTVAIDNLDFSIKRAEIVSILGPTGCGKSTALNLVAGFEIPTSGQMLLDRRPIAGPGPDRAVVFQQAALFPWLTVQQNITLGVKSRGFKSTEYLDRAAHLLAAVKLGGFENHYPYQLSGGMQQRVQIARALISAPEVLLMDEPFGALDSQTRLMMQQLLLELWMEFGPTIVFITHDVAEAIFISDRILVMSQRPGRIKAEFTVDEAKPRGEDFLGSGKFISLQAELLRSLREEVG